MLAVPPFRPWDIGEQSSQPCFVEAFGASAWAIGLAVSLRISPDSVLAMGQGGEGFSTDWFEQGYENDPLWLRAVESGVASATLGAAHALGAKGDEALVVCWPATSGLGLQRRDWYAVLTRPKKPWIEAEQRKVSLALRRMQADWDALPEDGLSRWLLGTDGRVLHADAQTQAGWPTDQTPVPGWASQIHEVVGQRWDAPTTRRVYDFVLAHDNGAANPSVNGNGHSNGESQEGGNGVGPVRAPADWVRVHHRPTRGGLGGGDYVETRPVDTQDAPPVGLVDDARVGRALGYLIDEYAQSPGLKDVAAVVESSPFHFHRLFSRVVGVSPKHYVLRTQLQMAKWRLRTAPLPVGDIATEVGFSSHGHFTATFHRIVGESPTDYRDRHAPLGFG